MKNKEFSKNIISILGLLFLLQCSYSQKSDFKSIAESALRIAKTDKIPTLELILWKPTDSIYIDYHNSSVNDVNRYGIGSATKMLVAVFILDLVEREMLHLNDQVSNFLDDNHPGLWHNISVEQLLNHTSGLPDYTRNPEWGNLVSAGKTPRSFEQRASLISSIKTSSNSFHYSNSNYLVLEKIVEKVTGKTYDTAFNAYYESLGLPDIRISTENDTTQTFFAQDLSTVSDVSNAQEFYGYAGDVHATSAELLKFMKKLFIEKSILSVDQLDLMKTSINMEHMTIPIGTGIIDHYGLGLMELKLNHQYYIGHSGGTLKYQSFLFYRPEDQAIIIALTNSSGTYYNNSFVQHLLPTLLEKI